LQKLVCQTEAAPYGDDIPPLRLTLGTIAVDEPKFASNDVKRLEAAYRAAEDAN
jgi:hypothetical protein